MEARAIPWTVRTEDRHGNVQRTHVRASSYESACATALRVEKQVFGRGKVRVTYAEPTGVILARANG